MSDHWGAFAVIPYCLARAVSELHFPADKPALNKQPTRATLAEFCEKCGYRIYAEEKGTGACMNCGTAFPAVEAKKVS